MMSIEVKQEVILPSGTKYPIIGIGTHNVTGGPGSVREAVKYAIDIGYRSVDCAYVYENEKEVGDAIQSKLDDGTIKDKCEIFITAKLWDTHHDPKTMKKNIKKYLQNLQVHKIQLLLVHWPISLQESEEIIPRDNHGNVKFVDIDIVDTWKGMEELVDAGFVENIGLSNFNKSQIERILLNSRIKPCNIQVEIHPYFSNKRLVEFCQSNGMSVTAYAPLANPQSPLRTGSEPDIFKEQTLINLSKEKGKSIAQIVLRFLLQRKIIVIPKSITPSRIKENLDVFSFSLNAEEMNQLWSLDRNLRIWLESWTISHKDYPFHDEY